VRDKQAVIAVLAVVAVVLGFVVLVNALTAPKSADVAAGADTTTSTPSSSTSASTSASATPTATPSVLPGCAPVPGPQATPKRMASAPNVDAARGKTFVATVTTNCGPITIELDGAKAPATVSSFSLLAKEGYWAPSPCHRLTGDAECIWVLQCGDPTGTGSGPGPGYHYGIENAPADGKYPAGTVAMARTSDPNSNADQFFITYKDTTLPVEGGGYSIFGKVTGGMEIINRVAAAGVSPSDQMSPMAPISILSVSVEAKG